MHVRVTRGQMQPGKLDAAIEQWKDFWGAKLPEQPGFNRAYFNVDRSSSRVMGVTVWDTAPDEGALAPLLEQFRNRISDLAVGPPQVETYETVAEIE